MSNRPNRTPSHSSRVAKAQSAGRGSNVGIWIVVGAIVVVAAIVAIALSLGGDDGPEGGSASPSGGTVVPAGDLSYGEVSVAGTPLPELAGTPDPAVGATLPTIEGQQFDGEAISIAPDGRPMVVMGLAHWCPHCQREVPKVQEWLDENGMPDDVQLVSIATATDEGRPNFSPGEWLRGEGWSVPTLVDDQMSTAGNAIGIGGFPAFVVVGGDGEVVFRTSGELSIEQWEAVLEAARTGQAPA